MLETSKEKHHFLQRQAHRNNTILFNRNFKSRSAWNDVFQVLKDNCQAGLLYPGNPCVIIEGKIKTFRDKNKLKEFMTSKPAPQKILKESSILKRKTNLPLRPQEIINLA